MRIRVDERIFELFPEARIHVLVAHDLDNSRRPDGFDAELERRELAAAQRHAGVEAGSHPFLASWRNAYRAFGTNPRSHSPAAEALLRRLRKSRSLPRISWVVDAYNVVAVTHLLPLGAYDLAKISGDVLLTRAQGDEWFVPLGRDVEPEHPRPGEVVYRDRQQILTRHWNHRDSAAVAIAEATTSAVFFCEAADAAVPSTALARAVGDLAGLLAPAERIAEHRLDATAPEATVL